MLPVRCQPASGALALCARAILPDCRNAYQVRIRKCGLNLRPISGDGSYLVRVPFGFLAHSSRGRGLGQHISGRIDRDRTFLGANPMLITGESAILNHLIKVQLEPEMPLTRARIREVEEH